MLSLFQPSGLNEQFTIEKNLSFADYLAKTRDMIAEARLDLTPATASKIIAANAPYEYRPLSPARKGILLVHGLYDCPFLLQDLGKHFAAQGLLVRSILLPGHGTVPGDLLNVHHSEWIKAVDYGVDSLAQEVAQIFIAGFSLGGVLAVYKALCDKRIQGLLLIAPALALQSQWLVGLLIRWQKWLQWRLPEQGWYVKRNFQKDYSKYESFCSNAAQQIYQLILKTKILLQQNTLSIPIFLTISAEDEVVCPKTCLTFFSANTHVNSRLLWYTPRPKIMQDSRIITKSSAIADKKIIDFSHICLPIAPSNSHYGVAGDYQSFLQYPDNQPPSNKEIFLGAVSRTNLNRGVIQRLSYNPDFAAMLEEIAKSQLFDC
jgi:esterase/lipase